jgi:hypothetical protein
MKFFLQILKPSHIFKARLHHYFRHPINYMHKCTELSGYLLRNTSKRGYKTW